MLALNTEISIAFRRSKGKKLDVEIQLNYIPKPVPVGKAEVAIKPPSTSRSSKGKKHAKPTITADQITRNKDLEAVKKGPQYLAAVDEIMKRWRCTLRECLGYSKINGLYYCKADHPQNPQYYHPIHLGIVDNWAVYMVGRKATIKTPNSGSLFSLGRESGVKSEKKKRARDQSNTL